MPKGYHNLTCHKRCQIQVLLKRGDSYSSIAKAINVHPSTISREIKRNQNNKQIYNSYYANLTAHNRKSLANKKKIKLTKRIKQVIRDKLRLQWSPVQISGWFRHKCNKKISHQTIYSYVWRDKEQKGELYKQLRHRGKRYRKRNYLARGWGSISGRIDIDQRPSIVERKERIGDWELDTIVGHKNSGYIVSMVDRATKLVKLYKVKKRTAYNVEQAILNKLKPIKACVETLTSDNGKEFAYHKSVGAELDARFYFAKPYSSWERGLNEHTNGLVRQYFPKSLRFDTISQEDLDKLEERLNTRPRKILHFDTPKNVFRRLEKRLSKYCTSPLKGPRILTFSQVLNI